MNRAIVFSFLLPFFQAFSQDIYVPELGFRYVVPTDAIDFSDELILEDEVSYTCFFSLPTKNEGEKFSLAFTASADGNFHNVSHVKHYEMDVVNSLYPEAEIVSENDSLFVFKAQFMGVDHTIYKYFSFSNNISYVRTVYLPKGFKNSSIDTSLNYHKIDYVKPVIDYSSISELIKKTPEDATLWYQRAKRKFNYHDYDGSINDCTVAIDLLGMYGEAYYLRAQCYFINGDTLRACQGYLASIQHEYWGEIEFMTYCDTPEMQEAMEDNVQMHYYNEEFDADFNHLELADSLKQYDYFFISTLGEPNEEMKKYFKYLYHMSFLNFHQLDSLYHTGNDLIKLTSYLFIRQKFPESITSSHKEIFKNNNKITAVDEQSKLVKIKDIAKLFEKKINKNTNQENSGSLKAEKAIAAFIKQNALFPNSYHPSSFEVINVYRINNAKNFESIAVKHVYELKNVEGKTEQISHVFKLRNNFQITIIEAENSSAVYSDPPKIKDWLKQYGKP